MGFRFRKSIKILPGVKLNLGKKSTSISVGTRGATVNFSKKGTRTTIGLPGTGISYTSYNRKNANKPNYNPNQNKNYTKNDYIISIIVFLIIFGLGSFIITSCKNNKREKEIQAKILQDTCYAINDDLEWCKHAPKVSMRGTGLLIDSNFQKFLNLSYKENNYIFHSGIENIKSKSDPNVKYGRVYIQEENFRPVPNTEKTFIMDKNFEGIKAIDGNIFEKK